MGRQAIRRDTHHHVEVRYPVAWPWPWLPPPVDRPASSIQYQLTALRIDTIQPQENQGLAKAKRDNG